MEGETEASIANQFRMFNERVLPTLDNNIKDGNSLIDIDYYAGQLDFGEEKKIKPFSWKRAFPEVFNIKVKQAAEPDPKEKLKQALIKTAAAERDLGDAMKDYISTFEESYPKYGLQGGFDVVIGNPPYRTLQLGKKQESQEQAILNYYHDHYTAAFEYKLNLYALFMEKSISLMKDEGYFSFIVPNSLYNTISFKPIRKLLLDKGGFEIIMDLRYKVFEDAEIGGSAIFVFTKNKKIKESEVLSIQSLEDFLNPIVQKVSSKDFLKDPEYNLIQTQGGNKLLQTIKKLKGVVELGSIIKIYQGIITGDNKKYISNNQTNSQWHPILKGRDINRYQTTFNDNYVYYSPKDLWSNTDEKMFKVKEKIISRQTSDKIVGTLDTKGYFSLDSTHVIHLLTDKIDIKYLLGIYNSKLLNYIYQNRVQEIGRVFAQVKTINLKPLPIKVIDSNNKLEKEKEKEIIKLVDQLLKLNEEKAETKLQTKISQLESKIYYCENRINEIVYQLYELTDDEIKIIEST